MDIFVIPSNAVAMPNVLVGDSLWESSLDEADALWRYVVIGKDDVTNYLVVCLCGHPEERQTHPHVLCQSLERTPKAALLKAIESEESYAQHLLRRTTAFKRLVDQTNDTQSILEGAKKLCEEHKG